MEPECNFWGVKIPAGAAVEVEPAFSENFITSIHLTQVALGDKPKPGGHTIFIAKEDGEKFALGTLHPEKCTHFSLDIHLATSKILLTHNGKSDVYLTGYEAVSVAGDDEPGFPMASDDEETGSEEESGEEEEEEAPQAVPLSNGRGRMVMVDDMAEEGSSDEDEDDGEEDSDDEGEDGLLGSEEDSEEDESSKEEEESSEEEAPQPPAAKAGTKRAGQPPPTTPQPAKRSKQEGAHKVAPATAPPKVAGATPAGGGGEYLAKLKAYLSAKGPTKLASLGSAVKRPPNAPKLKHFLEQNKATFKYDLGTDSVSLLA